MNKTVKTVLMVAGVVLLVYGIYKVVAPEAAVDFGPVDFEAQDNTNAYIAIGLGIVALLASFFGGKKA
ncbi:MAG: hypothetical protein HKN99_10730 [Winogradskyella sp.]|nr:hypothetical protein [Winogradskyella sp.]MBT8376286.1 hypothetical protein [Bacteroidia bacterium]NNC46346.1 hypothetical protein [Winogradskyella sp.]NNL83666.1 hypothetical protein [Winogradskyella sp.]